MKKSKNRRLKSSKQAVLKKRRKKRRIKRAVVLLVEIFLLAILGLTAFSMFKLDKMNMTVLDNIQNNGLEKEGFTNVALFGTDNRLGEVEGVRSDCIIVASINNETYEVKLMSVYRDTLLLQSDGYFNKANSAYHMGGPEEAINMLNRNLDLDIKEYATVNFMSLTSVIDLLGGIDMELTGDEITNMNQYIPETASVAGKEAVLISSSPDGIYHLDGVQAVTYCRIRSTEGGDYRRTERQRIMIEKIVEKAKGASFRTLNEIIDTVLPEVSTSFTAGELVKLAANVFDFKIGESQAFPFEQEASTQVPGYTGWYIVPVGLEQNVKQAHAFLFQDEEYIPTEKLVAISDELAYITGVYPVVEGIEETYTEDDIYSEDEVGDESE